MLYLGLFGCGLFNLEYAADHLYLHCHTAGPWMSIAHTRPDSTGAPIIVLVVIRTSAVTPGSLYITEEDRIERWLADQVTTKLLGVVTITS